VSKKKKIIGAGLASLLLVTVLSYRLLIAGPAIGEVKRTTSLNEVKGAQLTRKQVDSTYFVTTIPSTLLVKTTIESGGGGIYAQYLYAEPAFGNGSQLGITIGHLNGMSLEEIPFIKQRLISPDVYQQVSKTSTSVTYQTNVKDEYATIWVYGSDYVAVAASGRSDSFGSLKEMVEESIRSWQWR